MLVIILTVVTQGFTVPAENKGGFSKSLLTVNDGVFQAIGVISFGKSLENSITSFTFTDLITIAFVCRKFSHYSSILPGPALIILHRPQQPPHLWIPQKTYIGQICPSNTLLDGNLHGSLPHHGRSRLPHIRRQDCRKCPEQLSNKQHNGQHCQIVNSHLPPILPFGSSLTDTCCSCFGLNMLTTLPLEAFVCREVMETYYFPGEPFNMNRHLIFSSALVVSAMALSLMTCDLGVVFELIGATSACALAYILPPLCYMKLASRSWRTYAAGATVAFGVVVMVISLLQSVYKMISGNGGPTTC